MTTDVFEEWDRYCDSLKDLGRWVQEQAEIGDDLDRAEGIRYLSRLVRGTLESHMEVGDAAHPQQATTVPDASTAAKVTSTLGDITASLTFTEHGLQAVFKIHRHPTSKK